MTRSSTPELLNNARKALIFFQKGKKERMKETEKQRNNGKSKEEALENLLGLLLAQITD
ncbi:MAG: hypothetical protein Q8P67_19095 [archaeon]|nr:hypothetical protein [archaeon]